MKHLKKLGLSLALFSLAALLFLTHDTTAFAAGNDDFVVKDGVLIEYQGKDAAVEIPADWGITAIGTRAFNKNESITSVVIPKGVTAIGDSAFGYCRNLTSVTIPQTVSKIGAWSFEDCSSLTTISLPTKLTTLGMGAFAACGELQSINIR